MKSEKYIKLIDKILKVNYKEVKIDDPYILEWRKTHIEKRYIKNAKTRERAIQIYNNHYLTFISNNNMDNLIKFKKIYEK